MSNTFYKLILIQFAETLRKYPPLQILQRVSDKDYKVPGTGILLDRGTDVFIPVRAIHYDPEIYENPIEFRPERFNPPEEIKRHSQSFLGFGDGPRNCIGLRFGRMQAKVGLIKLLSNYKFSHSSETSTEIEFSDYNIGIAPLKGINLKVEKL